MVSDTQVRCVALFFLFAFLDEKVALPIADRTVASLKNKIGRFAEESAEARQILISACISQFQKNKKQLERGKQSPSLPTALRLPLDTDLKAWIQFQKEAGEEELLSVLFGQVLGFNATDISAAMSVSEGTTNYRIGNGVRRLGELERTLHPGADA